MKHVAPIFALLAMASIMGCAAETDEELADTESDLSGYTGTDDGDVDADAEESEEDAEAEGGLKGFAAAAATGPYKAACPTSARLSQGFKSGHDGVDLANARGTPIFSTGPGTVTVSGAAQGYGQWIRIRHDDGSMTEYGHMYQRLVNAGARVTAGQRIALMGSEGQSTGPHLHLRTYANANNVGSGKGTNPVAYLKARGIAIPCKPGTAAAPAPAPGGATQGDVTLWKAAAVLDCAKSTCNVVQQLAKDATPAAVCWTAGELISSDGYTNDKWVKLDLGAGKTGFINGIALRGDKTGGVTKQCP